MSMINIESTTWVDLLPTEIIFHILNYLSNNDIIYTFFFFSQRLNNLLLQNQRYLNYSDIPTLILNTWKNILSIIGPRIGILNIDTLCLSHPLTLFPNVKSIIISSPFGLPEEQVKLILECEQFQNLHSLKIKENKLFSDRLYNNYLTNQDYILAKVLKQTNSLKTFEYFCITPSFELISTNNFETNFNLHSLTLMLTDFRDIFTLIYYTPNLKYLNVQSEFPYQGQKSTNNVETKLEQFHLKISKNRSISNTLFHRQIDFDQLINGIQQFSSLLTCLSLNLVDLDIEITEGFPFDSAKLQQFLEAMVELKQFHLYAILNNARLRNDDILSRFQGSFWFDHKWSFGMHLNYFYTLPFYFDYLRRFTIDFNDVKSSNAQILINNPRIWYNVKTIDVLTSSKLDLNFVKKLKIKMPKLNTIKLSNSWKIRLDERQDLHEKETTCVALDNVTTVHTHFAQCSIEYIKEWFIYALPNLKHIYIWSTRLPSIVSQLTPIFNEKVQELNINAHSDLEQLAETSCVYFSNVNHIYFQIFLHDFGRYQWLAEVVMKLLKNFKNLKILVIYILQSIESYTNHPTETALKELIRYLDTNEITKNYEVQHFREYSLFSRRIFYA